MSAGGPSVPDAGAASGPSGRARDRILVWGDVIDDIVVRPRGPVRPDTDTPAEIRSRPGGSAANVAAWLGRLGAGVDFVGRVGEHDVARHAAELEAVGVAAHLIADPSRPTGTIVVIVDDDNRRTMLTERGANSALRAGDIPGSLLESAALVHFTGYSVFSSDDGDGTDSVARDRELTSFIARASVAGAQVSVDPGSAGFLRDYGTGRFIETVRGAQILLPNSDEAAVLTGISDPAEAAVALTRDFPVVVVTLGSDGVVVAERGASPRTVPVRKVPRADTTGAGDAFAAGFLTGWVGGLPALEAAERGAALAAESLGRVGGRPE